MITYLHWILLPLGTVYPLCTTTDGENCILPATPQDDKRRFDQCSSYKKVIGSNDKPWCYTKGIPGWGTCKPECPGALPVSAYFVPGNQPGTCNSGILNVQIKTRIVTGVPAFVGMLPWQVALLGEDSIFKQECGGVLIGKRHVLTTAHCVFGTEYVLVGATDLAVKDEGLYADNNVDIPTGRKIIGVSETRIHPGYNDNRNDIAVLILDSPVDLSRYPNIKPISISTKPASSFSVLLIAGWGAARFKGDSTYLLQYGLIAYTKNCDKSNQAEDQFCATGSDNGNIIGSCHGDSGGPIIALTQNGHGLNAVLIGLVKGGSKECAKDGYPGVYTDVYYHVKRNWLQNALLDAEGCQGPLAPNPPDQQVLDVMKFAFPYFSGIMMKIEKVLNSLDKIETRTANIKQDLRKIDSGLDSLNRIERGTSYIYRDVRKIRKKIKA